MDNHTSLCDLVQEFASWLESGAAELSCPMLWQSQKPLSPVGLAVHRLLVVQAFRPDRLMAAAAHLVGAAVGADFMHGAEREMNIGVIVESEIRAQTPVLMCSVPGYDASGRVDDLAAELNKQITSIAIGQCSRACKLSACVLSLGTRLRLISCTSVENVKGKFNCVLYTRLFRFRANKFKL